MVMFKLIVFECLFTFIHISSKCDIINCSSINVSRSNLENAQNDTYEDLSQFFSPSFIETEPKKQEQFVKALNRFKYVRRSSFLEQLQQK